MLLPGCSNHIYFYTLERDNKWIIFRLREHFNFAHPLDVLDNLLLQHQWNIKNTFSNRVRILNCRDFFFLEDTLLSRRYISVKKIHFFQEVTFLMRSFLSRKFLSRTFLSISFENISFKKISFKNISFKNIAFKNISFKNISFK